MIFMMAFKKAEREQEGEVRPMRSDREMCERFVFGNLSETLD